MTNKKSTKKALLSSVLALVLCVSMLIGATFAWFTDTASTGVNTIQSGKLDVVLEYSKDDGATWENAEGKVLDFMTADNRTENILWEPGCTYELPLLRVRNNGNLALKYQIVITGLTGDAKLLEVIDWTVNDATLTDTYTGTLTPKAESAPLLIKGHMQESAGNEYQDLKIENISITVYATQLNYEKDSYGPDYDGDALVCDVLATPENIDDILASVEPGTVIGLSAGYYDEIVLTQDNLTLVSNSGVVGFLNLNAKDGTTIDGLTFDESGAQQTYTFKTGNKQEATEYVANITGDTNSPKAADNLVIKNCTFTNTSGVAAAAVSQYIPIYFNEQGAATERATNITIDNCVFACNAVQYIGLNYLAVGNVAITNNTFGGGAYGTSHNTINATGNAANWTITGNSFNNWNIDKTAIGSSKQGSNTVTWTITDNEFNHKDGAVILALKTSYNASNSVVTVANNTVLNGNGITVTTDVDAENGAAYAGHKIQVNEGVTVATSSDELKDVVKNVESGDTIILTEGEYSLPSLGDKEGVTIDGAEGTVIGGENASTGFGSNFGKNTTIKNITFSGSSNGVRWSYAKGGTSTFENCTFAGDSTYGFHIDESKGATFIFNNCTFIGFNAFAGDLVKVTFNNCTFLSNGSYGHTNIWSVGEFNNCTWGDNTSVSPAGSGKLFFNGVEESYHHEYVGSAESLFAFAESVNEGGDSWKGQKVLLVADIDLENMVWTPIGQTGSTTFSGSFDGQGHTISNLTVDSSAQTGANYSSGLFGWIEIHGYNYTVIENVKIDNATITGNHNCGTIVGYATGCVEIKNCEVTNSTVSCNVANSDANGDKAGMIVGNLTAEPQSKVTNCSASNCTVSAGRDAGQLVGAGNVENVTGTATNVTVTANGQGTGANINNELVGRNL